MTSMLRALNRLKTWWTINERHEKELAALTISIAAERRYRLDDRKRFSERLAAPEKRVFTGSASKR